MGKSTYQGIDMSEIIVRQAECVDEADVQKLCKRNGLRSEKSNNAWQWIWEGNRFYNDNLPLGWVLVSDDTIVGFFGNHIVIGFFKFFFDNYRFIFTLDRYHGLGQIAFKVFNKKLYLIT